jgi:peptidoglycan/LPS O-acetylase OafA/YrhL
MPKGVSNDPSSSLSFMPRLDGLRAVAIGGVLIEHFCPVGAIQRLSPGGAGVSLFFVLSGYLITRILLQYRARDVPVGKAAVHFYSRRILRLSPPYYLAIAVTFALGLYQMRSDWWVHALYLSNIQIAIAGLWTNGADHFWSLSVEEQFYLLWFFIAVAMPKRFLPWMILCAFLITFVFRAGVYFLHLSPLTTVLLPGNLATLAMGALVVCAGEPGKVAKIDPLFRNKPLLIASGLSFTLLSFSLPFAYAPNAFLYPFVAATFFACVVRIAADPQGERWCDWLGWAPVRHIGKISYGIYVYHLFLPGLFIALLPVLGNIVIEKDWSSFIILTVSSVVLAEISWYCMERPVLRLKPALSVKAKRGNESVQYAKTGIAAETVPINSD